MPDDLHTVTIVFKPGPAQKKPTRLVYRMSAEELGRLIANAPDVNDCGSYDVTDKAGETHVLFLRFADLLYIA